MAAFDRGSRAWLAFGLLVGRGEGAALLPRHEVISRYQGRHVRLFVLVESGATKPQLEELTKDLVERQDLERIDYVDFPALVATKPSLGFWDKYEGPRLREKDWRRRPAPQDVQLWVERGSISAGDEDAARELAARHGLDTGLVSAGITKVRDWIANADS